MTATPRYNRRQIIKGMTASLGVLSLRGFAADGKADAYFTHGIASGDPLADRVILWTRVLPGNGQAQSLEVGWQVADDERFEQIVSQGKTRTNAARDYTVKVDATGLQSGRAYYYRFEARGVRSGVGRTRTLPAGTVSAFTMAVCSCSNFPQGYFNAYRDIAESDLDAVLHLGDYIYEYGDGVYSNPVAVEQLGRRVRPGREILTLEDYRMRYGLYRSDEDLQAAHATHPWICVWDDHELMNNTWKAGAENHNEGEGDFATRIALARKAYHEWMPIRTAPEGDQGPIFRSFPVGDLADIIMLDARLHGRDKQLDYARDIELAGGMEAFTADLLWNDQRSMLGHDQEAWLAQELAASKQRGATWQVIGQQVLMGSIGVPEIPAEAFEDRGLSESNREWLEALSRLHKAGMPWNLDAWNGYPAARQRAYATMLENAGNPVVLGGDTHNAWHLNLRDRLDTAVGIEIGVPGISSPGMEGYFPLPPKQLHKGLLASSPELIDLDLTRRGWTEVRLTPVAVLSQNRFVDTVLSRNYSVERGPLLRSLAGSRQFS